MPTLWLELDAVMAGFAEAAGREAGFLTFVEPLAPFWAELVLNLCIPVYLDSSQSRFRTALGVTLVAESFGPSQVFRRERNRTQKPSLLTSPLLSIL